MTFEEYVRQKNNIPTEYTEPICPFKFGGYCVDAYHNIHCFNCEWAEAEYAEEVDRNICPICGCNIKGCQCRFGGPGHPQRNKERTVVQDHLYLLSEKQLNHLIQLQKFWRTSYSGEEKTEMLGHLKEYGTAAGWEQ